MKKDNCEVSACRRKTSIGGQALIEGIMMRGPKKSAMAVRDPNGKIVLLKWNHAVGGKNVLFKIPVIRGIFNFISSMSSGYKCLMRSAEIAMPEDEEPKKKKKKKGEEAVADVPAETAELTKENSAPAEETAAEPEEAQTEKTETADHADNVEVIEIDEEAEKKAKKSKEGKKKDAVLGVAMSVGTVLGLVLAVGLFMWLPATAFGWLSKPFAFLVPENVFLASLIRSAIEGAIRLVIMIGYVTAISFTKDVRRTFMYHGAEHKTIFCYENGLELTVENVRKQSRFHPRCGTSFLVLMIIVGIIVSFFIDPLFVLAFGEEFLEAGMIYTAVRTAVKKIGRAHV